MEEVSLFYLPRRLLFFFVDIFKVSVIVGNDIFGRDDRHPLFRSFSWPSENEEFFVGFLVRWFRGRRLGGNEDLRRGIRRHAMAEIFWGEILLRFVSETQLLRGAGPPR